MLHHKPPLRWRLVIAAAGFAVRCGAASAQGALPPPSVTVTPLSPIR